MASRIHQNAGAWLYRKLHIWSPRFNRGLQFTRPGLWFTLITMLLGVGAINTGINTLFLTLCLFLNLLFLSGWLSEVTMQACEVEMEPRRLNFAQTPVILQARMRNRHRWVPLVAMRLTSAEWGMMRLVPFVAPGESIRFWLEGTPRPRGIYREVKLECRTSFPFGLFEKFRYLTATTEVWITPERLPIAPAIWHALGRQAGRAHDRNGQDEFFQMRPYRWGDPIHHIHWKKSATASEVLLNEYRHPLALEPFHLYCDPSQATSEEVYEKFLAWAFSLFQELREQQSAVKLWTAEGTHLHDEEQIAIWFAALPAFPVSFTSPPGPRPAEALDLYQIFREAGEAH